jgi:outer membrane protein, heavy metal efflux system
VTSPTLLFTGVVAVILVGTAGTACYRPEPVDARVLLNDLRASDSKALGGSPTMDPTVDVAATGVLTEDRGVAVALLWNRELRALRLTRGIAEGQVISAGALANPEIRMELTHLQERSTAQLGWDVRLTWEPPRPGVRAGRMGAASAHVEEVDRQVSEREWEIACDVRNAYATLLALDDEIRVAEDTSANRRRLSDAVARRVQKGGTTRFDLDLVRLSLASAEHAENGRRLARTLAAGALVRLLGVGPPGGTITVTGHLPDDTGDRVRPNQTELEDRALASRPAIAAAAARHRASDETLRAETAARWPWVRLSAAPRVRRKEFFGASTDLVLGLDVTLPILDTNRGHIQSATAARDTARAEILTTLADVRADIGRALAGIDAQRAILGRLQTEIVPLLAEHDRVLALAAQASEMDLPSLIASENLVLASRVELITARLELRFAWIALERAVGIRLVGPQESKSGPTQ